jgi:hypothetical protein
VNYLDDLRRSSTAARSRALSTWDDEGGFLPRESGIALVAEARTMRSDVRSISEGAVGEDQRTGVAYGAHILSCCSRQPE